MKASQFDGRAVELRQVKTGTYVWMPAHPALREHLTKIGIGGATLLAYGGKPYTPVGLSNLIRKTVERLGYPGYSAHGLRHLAGAALAECGASVHEIMSILGHTTEKQAMEYTRQANRKRMAAHAMAKWSA
jgi:integrase